MLSVEISKQSQEFLNRYHGDYTLSSWGADQTVAKSGLYYRATENSPRILGKLRWTFLNQNAPAKKSIPRSFSELYEMVAKDIIDCANGENIDQFLAEWTTRYTNLSAENQLRNSTPQTKGLLDPGNFVVFPFTGKGRPENLPELLFLNIHGCLSPSEPTSTRMFNNYIARRNLIKPGDHVLDLCCGSGVTAITASYLNPNGEICATDISEQAVETTGFNTDMHRRKNITVIQSDMFDQIKPDHQFNFIFINPPFTPKYRSLKPADKFLQNSVHDYGFTVITKLFNQAENYLKHDGSIIMLYEDIKTFGSLNAPEWVNIEQGNRYDIKTLLKIKRARIDHKNRPINIPMVIYAIKRK